MQGDLILMIANILLEEILFQVISHNKFGRHVFVATIVTNASSGSDVLENIMEEMAPDWQL